VSVRVFAYPRGAGAVEEHALDAVPGLVARDDVVLWLDICGHDGDAAHEQLLSNVFHVHPLVLEDMFQDAPQPKVEDFDDYLYVVVHGLDRRAEEPENIETIELDLLIGPRWVITHHPTSLRSTDSVEGEIRKSTKLFGKGPSFIAHAILDHLSDHYQPLMDRFEEENDALETKVLEEDSYNPTLEIFALRRSLAKIKRVAVYQQEVAKRLARGEFDQIDAAALPFYRDVADHFARIVDLADSSRDMLSAIFETYRSVQGQKLNEVMKLLTILSTVMLPLTFIAGIYGMNFEFMPELHWRYGYLFAIALMVSTTGALLHFFRRRRWL
jgi:magnesium transporter